MPRFNDRLFRLGDIGLGPCREQDQSASQFLPVDPGLPKDAHQQAATDVLGVRIGDPHQRPAVLSWLMLARRGGGNRPIGKRHDKYPEVKAVLSHPGGCLMGG